MADPIDGFRRVMVGTRTYFAARPAGRRGPSRPHHGLRIGTDEVGHVLAPLPAAAAAGCRSRASRSRRGSPSSATSPWSTAGSAGCSRPARSPSAPSSSSPITASSGWREPDSTPGERGGSGGAFAPGGGREWRKAPPRKDDRPREFSGVAAATAALWHRPRGMFVLAGNGVQRLGRADPPPSVYDVAPTVAALLGLPAGRGWPGRPLPGAPAPSRAPVDWTALVPMETVRPSAGSAPPSPEYVAQLKALGYLEGGEAAAPAAATGERHAGRPRASSTTSASSTSRRSATPRPSRRSAPRSRRTRATPRRTTTCAASTSRRGASTRPTASCGGPSSWACATAPGRRRGRRPTTRPPASPRGRSTCSARRPGASRATAASPCTASPCWSRRGRCPEAVDRRGEAAGRFPADADVHGFLGLAAACAGDDATARAAFERSLALAPDQPEIRAALAALER